MSAAITVPAPTGVRRRPSGSAGVTPTGRPSAARTSANREPASRTSATHEPASRTSATHEPASRTSATHEPAAGSDGGPSGRSPSRSRPSRSAGAGHTAGPARRSDDSLVGRLNAEWIRLCADPTTPAAVGRWRLSGVGSLDDLESAVRRDADGVLLTLLRLGRSGDALALRSAFQLMLGKAVRIAATHTGRDSRANLEQAAVTALWTVVAGYPVERRPVKVAANIAMDTLRLTVTELAHQRHETPSSPDELDPAVGGEPDERGAGHEPADLELFELLAWAVGNGTVSRDDATLLVDIYAPAPGRAGGSAAAERHGISWAAARQRASRATRRIAEAVRADDV